MGQLPWALCFEGAAHHSVCVCECASSTMPLELALDRNSSLMLLWPLPFPVSLQLKGEQNPKEDVELGPAQPSVQFGMCEGCFD